MSKAVMVREHGGPEVLSYEDRQLEQPGPGEVSIRNRAIGLNFIDTYQRSGLYKVPLPFVAGNEGAGEVTAVDFQYNAGHPGVEKPHYHVVLWHGDKSSFDLK